MSKAKVSVAKDGAESKPTVLEAKVLPQGGKGATNTTVCFSGLVEAENAECTATFDPQQVFKHPGQLKPYVKKKQAKSVSKAQVSRPSSAPNLQQPSSFNEAVQDFAPRFGMLESGSLRSAFLRPVNVEIKQVAASAPELRDVNRPIDIEATFDRRIVRFLKTLLNGASPRHVKDLIYPPNFLMHIQTARIIENLPKLKDFHGLVEYIFNNDNDFFER